MAILAALGRSFAARFWSALPAGRVKDGKRMSSRFAGGFSMGKDFSGLASVLFGLTGQQRKLKDNEKRMLAEGWFLAVATYDTVPFITWTIKSEALT